MTVATGSKPPTRVRVSEAASLAPNAAVRDDGTVVVHLMRPCVGRGMGRNVYEADMLRRHAESGHFNDWPMFVDHESPEARRKAGGLPRSFRDLGGRVVETWWDSSVPSDGHFGQGAVAASVLPVPWIQDMIRHDPKLAQVSLNTYASSVRPTSRGGRSAYVVEGFENEGSVDWVTRAGAGGKVVHLLEAAYDEGRDSEAVTRILEALTDEKLQDWLKAERPAVAEAIRTADHGATEEDDTVDKQQIQEATFEALRSEDGRNVLSEVVRDAASEAVQEALKDTLPGAIGRAAEVIEAQATSAAQMAVRRSQLRTRATVMVQEAKLPEKFNADVLKRVQEAADKAEDATGDDGEVTESAEDAFGRVAEAIITTEREKVASLKPTAVTGNGGGGEGTSDHEVSEAARSTVETNEEPSYWRHELAEAGVDVYASYGIKKPDGTAEETAAKTETTPAKTETTTETATATA